MDVIEIVTNPLNHKGAFGKLNECCSECGATNSVWVGLDEKYKPVTPSWCEVCIAREELDAG